MSNVQTVTNSWTDIRAAREFLTRKAAASSQPTRKYSGETSDRHSIRVTTRALRLLMILKPPKNSPVIAKTAKAALLHDTVEDFDVNRKEIASRFGLDTASDVETVTVPPVAELAARSPLIAGRFLELPRLIKDKQSFFEASFAQIKQDNPDQYQKIRSALVIDFKINRASQLGLELTLIKAEDGISTLEDYVKDIRAGRIVVKAGSSAVSPPFWRGHAPETMTTSAAHRKITERGQVQKAYMKRLKTLKNELCENGTQTFQGKRFDLMTRRLQQNFDNAADELRDVATPVSAQRAFFGSSVRHTLARFNLI